MHAMIDIETLGLGPTRNFVITSIGVVFFTPVVPQEFAGAGATQRYFDELVTNRSLEYYPDWEEQVTTGATIEPGTVRWWLGQNHDAREAIVDGHAKAMCTQAIWEHMSDAFVNDKDPIYVWGNGNVFDIVALEVYFNRFGLKAPWHFRNAMDLRTVKLVAEEVLGASIVPPSYGFGFTQHNAVHDAAAQVIDLQYYWRIINGTKT